MKVVVSWSGGKDGCFALYKAQKQGHEVLSLLTIMSSSGRSNFHMLPTEIIDSQAQAMGITIAKWKTSPKTYEQEFKRALFEMKTKEPRG